jgi:hypothetical protein
MLKASPREPDCEKDEFPYAVFSAYRDANLTYPQTDIGVVPIVSATLLSHDLETLTKALTRSFTEPQKASLCTTMDSVHQVFRVPVISRTRTAELSSTDAESLPLSVKVVDRDRLDVLWANIASFTTTGMLQFLAAITRNQLCARGIETYGCHANNVATVVQVLAGSSVSRQRLGTVFSLSKAILGSRQALEYSVAYRRAIKAASAVLLRNLPSLRTRFELQLAKLLADGLRRQFPEIADLIDAREWVVTRHLARTLNPID